MNLNSLGRKIPKNHFGKKLEPYQGLSRKKYGSTKRKSIPHEKYECNLNKRFYDSLDDLFKDIKIIDGLNVSFHHALRQGDEVINEVMDKFATYNAKSISLASTALFPVHKPLIKLIEDGTIGRIEGSMNGPIGNAVSKGEVKLPTILRSHGGRTRSVQEGSLPVNIAFITASGVDYLGNLSGVEGINQFGSIGYVKETDSLYADIVIAVTDTIVEKPLRYDSIPSSRVNAVVTVDKIGDPSGIASGSLGRQLKEKQKKIAELVADVVTNSKGFRNGFNWQSGAGGISMAASHYVKEKMLEQNLKGGYIFGGINKSSVEALNQNLFNIIFDAQSFDITAVNSLRDNDRHIEVSIDHAYNPDNKGECITNFTDYSVLGATEVDTDFNVNVNTYSNGLLVNGIGGHQDAAVAKTTIVTAPLARKVPTIIDRVTTVTTPGESVDVIVTEAGIAINPLRKDLIKDLSKTDIPIRSITDLKDESHSIADPIKPNLTEDIVTLVEYRDGTFIDVIYQIED